MADSNEVEYQLIGSILKDGRIFPKIAEMLAADKFHNTVCQDVFQAMEQVHGAGMVVDQVTVGDQLQRNGKLDTVLFSNFSSRAALSAMRSEGNPRNAESYANVVIDYYGKRAINSFLPKVAMWAQNGRRAVDIIADIRNEVDKLDQYTGELSLYTADAKIAASRAYDEAVRASNGEIKIAKLGYPELDKFFSMRQGSLTIVGGRPGEGKTAFIISTALNNAYAGRKSIIFSLEMTTEEVTARFLSQISGIPATRILDGKMTADEWARYHDAITTFERLPIVINDRPAITVNQLRQEARRILKSDDVATIYIDYIQLMQSGQKTQNRTDEIGVISRKLKEFAKSLPSRPPIVAAAQLSRETEKRANKMPQLSDLRESGSLEADADNVIFPYRESEDVPDTINQRQIIVAKQRNGGTGVKTLNWLAKTMRFEAEKTMQLERAY